MITGIIHPGSGLGDQLFTYILTRTTAVDHGYEFGFVGKENFKGYFMNLYWGEPTDVPYHVEFPAGKLIIDSPHTLFEVNTQSYNPEAAFIQDGLYIDGTNAQDEKYFEHRLDEISHWLQTESLFIPQDLCIINFRGGEYSLFPELFLTKDYWDLAMEEMRKINPQMKFEVHTDDMKLAKKYFPKIECISDIKMNWRSVRNASYVILANSAFGIIPALLAKANKVIAPSFWAGRNVKEWRRPQNYYKNFTYM